MAANSLTVKASRNTRASLRKAGAWSVVAREAGASGGQADLRLTAAQKVLRLDLDLQWKTDDTAGATIVDRAWVQSWLTASARQDRAAYQLTTNRKEIEVVFPVGVVINQAVVRVDGKRVESRAVAEDRLLILLPGQREGHRFAIELRYHFPEPRPPRGAMRLEFPQLGPDAWVRRMYWQLVLPVNEMSRPIPAVSSASSRGLAGLFLGTATVARSGAIGVVGRRRCAPLPERATSTCSARWATEQAEVHTAGRTWIVLGLGRALVAGLLLIYVPASRHPATLLVVGIVLLAAGMIAPEPTLLLAQAASLGLVLTLLAGLGA